MTDNDQTRYQLFSSRYIDDQTITQSDWIKGTTDHTQPKEATFPWLLSPSKESKRTWSQMIKEPAIWLEETHNLRYSLIPSRDIDNQRITQSNWLRGF